MTNPTIKNPSQSEALSLEIFDPALCCSTGVCGTEVDQELVRFAADAAWLAAQGARVVRHNLAQEPLLFAQHPVVSALLKVNGEQALPLVLCNGQLALSGRYPSRDELSEWLGTQGTGLTELNTLPAMPSTDSSAKSSDKASTGGCCGGGDC